MECCWWSNSILLGEDYPLITQYTLANLGQLVELTELADSLAYEMGVMDTVNNVLSKDNLTYDVCL
jgi:hypothetical protein